MGVDNYCYDVSENIDLEGNAVPEWFVHQSHRSLVLEHDRVHEEFSSRHRENSLNDRLPKDMYYLNYPSAYEEAHYRQSRYMANVAGVGFDAHVVRKLSHLKKKGHKSRWRYTWCVVKNFFRYKSTGIKVWVDDRLVYNNLLFSAAVGICKFNGGGMQPLPAAIADDGILDLSLIRPVHFWHLLFRFHYLFNGGIYRIRHILQERGSRIRIESSPEVSVEIDGEPLGHTPLEFSILHRAIRIVVSPDFPGLKNPA